MKFTALISSLVIPASMIAQTYLTENFVNYIPSTFTIIDGNSSEIQKNIYANIGKDGKTAWTCGQLDNGYGRVAMALTRREDATSATDSWMILPPVQIADRDAVIRWEARSLHKHIPESYKVSVREKGTDTWTDIYVCQAESHNFTTHGISLSGYEGKDVEIAFIANTTRGFILAVDNVMVGVPTDDKTLYHNHSLHYVGDDGKAAIDGTLSYYGSSSQWTELTLTCGDYKQSMPLPTLKCGDSVDIHFEIPVTVGERYDYSLTAISENASDEICKDFVTCSYYPRVHVIDRGSGTWCNNCPVMELTTTKLENIYHDQITIVEAHINDLLVNKDYWNTYLSGNVYSIPCLVPNHKLESIVYKLGSNDDMSSRLGNVTTAIATSTVKMTANNEVKISSEAQFAKGIDNNTDHIRLAYMIIGDLYDPYNGFYLQSNSASNYHSEQYFYQPENILPEMMYFDNLPIEASVAYNGVPASLPLAINANEIYHHVFSLHVPEGTTAENLRLLTMIIDHETGEILNSSLTKIEDPSGITDIINDLDDSDAVNYDIMGRKASSATHGLIIEKRGSKIIKKINK